RQRLTAQVGGDAPAEPGQERRDQEHVSELAPLPARPPLRVVQILPTPGCIDAGRLEMASWIWTYPYVAPCGRDGQLPAPPHLVRIDQDGAALVDEREPAPPTAPPVTGLARITTPKPHA